MRASGLQWVPIPKGYPYSYFLSLLLAGQTYLALRPTPLGTDPAADAFERTWNRAALSGLEDGDWTFEQTYLTPLVARYRSAGARTIDPRTVLAEAIGKSRQCCRQAILAALENRGQNVAGHLGMASSLETVIRLFQDAAKAPEVRPEALVRGAFLLIHDGQPDQALQWLEQVDPANPDHELLYWANLFRGRALDTLGRFADAERAYRDALAAWHRGESAQVGLALDLLRLGRGAEAAEAAAEAERPVGEPSAGWTILLAAPPPAAVALVSFHSIGGDPWSSYEMADHRFLKGWLDALRRAGG